jgi:hypothetical protein
VGGKNKSDVQIKGLDQAFVVRDDVEFPVSSDLFSVITLFAVIKFCVELFKFIQSKQIMPYE